MKSFCNSLMSGLKLIDRTTKLFRYSIKQIIITFQQISLSIHLGIFKEKYSLGNAMHIETDRKHTFSCGFPIILLAFPKIYTLVRNILKKSSSSGYHPRTAVTNTSIYRIFFWRWADVSAGRSPTSSTRHRRAAPSCTLPPVGGADGWRFLIVNPLTTFRRCQLKEFSHITLFLPWMEILNFFQYTKNHPTEEQI